MTEIIEPFAVPEIFCTDFVTIENIAGNLVYSLGRQCVACSGTPCVLIVGRLIIPKTAIPAMQLRTRKALAGIFEPMPTLMAH